MGWHIGFKKYLIKQYVIHLRKGKERVKGSINLDVIFMKLIITPLTVLYARDLKIHFSKKQVITQSYSLFQVIFQE